MILSIYPQHLPNQPQNIKKCVNVCICTVNSCLANDHVKIMMTNLNLGSRNNLVACLKFIFIIFPVWLFFPPPPLLDMLLMVLFVFKLETWQTDNYCKDKSLELTEKINYYIFLDYRPPAKKVYLILKYLKCFPVSLFPQTSS